MHTAQDLMQRQVIAVLPQTPTEEAIDLLIKNDVSGLPVVDRAGRIVGIFSEVDRIQRGSKEKRSVQHSMTKKVATVDVQDSLVEVARIFRDNSVRRLPVTENGVMVGIIGLRDLVRYIRETERTLERIVPVFQESKLVESECWCNAD